MAELMPALTKIDLNNPASLASVIAAYAGKTPSDLVGKLVVVYEHALNVEVLTRDQVQARLESAVSRSALARAHTPLDVILVTKPPADIFKLLQNEVSMIVVTPMGPMAFGVQASDMTNVGVPRNHAAQAALLRAAFFWTLHLRTTTIARGDTSVVFTRPVEPPTPSGTETKVNPSIDETVGAVCDILSEVKPFDLGAIQTAIEHVDMDLVIDYDLKTNAVVYFQRPPSINPQPTA